MAQWEIDGKVYEFSGDTPPTAQQVAQIMGSQPSPVAGPAKAGMLERTGQFLRENMELPMGIGGAAAGAALGAPLGPPGMVVGGILGGALGSGGGSLTSDILANQPLNYEQAAKEAAISAGIDVATLGLGKVARPLLKALDVSASDLYRTLRPRTPVVPTGAATVGTQTSLQQTQELLAKGGGTLSAAQTNRAGKFRLLAQQLGDIGILSGARARGRVAQNANILKEEVQRQINGLNPSLAMGPMDLGESVFDIIDQGRRANSAIFSQNLDTIAVRYGSKQVPVPNIRNELVRFRDGASISGRAADGTQRTMMSALDETTQKEVNSLISSLDGISTMDVGALMALQKRLNSTISQVSDIKGQAYNSAAARELSSLSSKVRGAISDSLGWVSPDLKDAFATMNKTFGDAAETLLPKITQNVVSRADKGTYEAIGNLLVGANSPSQIKALLGSVDEAFNLAQKANMPLNGAIKTADEALSAIRQSYIANTFGDVAGAEDIYRAKFASIADKLEVPKLAEPVQAILGSAYPDYKRLVNAISDASHKSDSSLFGLALRSKELSAIQGAASVATVGTGVGMGPVAALGVFLLPEVLSRVATNKAAVNRLLYANNVVAKGNLAPEAVFALSAKVFEALTPEDRNVIRQLINSAETEQ